MKVTPDELEGRLDRFRETCTKAGFKLTHQRLEIFREVAKSMDHPDAETVFKGVRKRMPTVSLDTVYRTLWVLLDLGLITTVGPFRERVRFDANLGSHHHFVCVKCGKTRDFVSSEFDKLKIPDSIKPFGSVEKMQMEVRGRCNRCMK